jgi:hypothetical protein
MKEKNFVPVVKRLILAWRCCAASSQLAETIASGGEAGNKIREAATAVALECTTDRGQKCFGGAIDR